MIIQNPTPTKQKKETARPKKQKNQPKQIKRNKSALLLPFPLYFFFFIPFFLLLLPLLRPHATSLPVIMVDAGGSAASGPPQVVGNPSCHQNLPKHDLRLHFQVDHVLGLNFLKK